MSRRVRIAALLGSGWVSLPIVIQSADMSSMYTTATLQEWASRYTASSNRILNNYVFQYLSSRVGTASDKTYAKPMTLYTYLVIHVTPLVPPQPAAATGIVPGS